MARHPRWKGTGLNNNTLLAIELDGPIAARADQLRPRSVPGRLPMARGTPPASVPVGPASLGRRSARDADARPVVRRAVLTAKDQLERVLPTELNTPVDPDARRRSASCLLDGERAACGRRPASWC